MRKTRQIIVLKRNLVNMYGKLYWLTILLSFYFFGIVHCQSLENVKSLTSDLLSDYDKRQRPVLDQSGPVYVNVTMDILTIQVNAFF